MTEDRDPTVLTARRRAKAPTLTQLDTDRMVAGIADERLRKQIELERVENDHELAMYKAKSGRWRMGLAVVLVFGVLMIGGFFGIPVAVEGLGVSVSTVKADTPVEAPAP